MNHKRDWRQYNKTLVNRGKINFWIEKKAWYARKERKNGAPYIYSNETIQALLYLRFTFSLSLRTLEGFVLSLFALQKVTKRVPCYTQICRRMKTLVLPPNTCKKRAVTDIVLDTTGLKVYGVGEWRAKKYGGRSRWKKLHIAINLRTGKIIHSEATSPYKHDTELLEKILQKGNRRKGKLLIDGIGDSQKCYALARRYNKQLLTPPRTGAIIRAGPEMEERNDAIRIIKGLGGDLLARTIWAKFTDYSKRALIESTISRWKRLYGASLKSQTAERIQKEVEIKSYLINKMIDQELEKSA